MTGGVGIVAMKLPVLAREGRGRSQFLCNNIRGSGQRRWTDRR